MLYDRKQINLHEKIIDIFPDKLPAQISPNLQKMTVYHLLTMTTGHERCIMSDMYNTKDAAMAFLSQPVSYEPGTYFMYNTGASCMLAEIVKRKTGRKLFDFAYETLFEPLGIENVYWTECAQGVNEGGIGLHICNDDIAKFGLMLLHEGLYNGKRILSQDWCRQMGAAQVDNSNNGDSGSGNWTSGYGYQCWITKKDGYRADGAGGQLCMVMPSHKAVVAINARTINMEKEIVDTVDLIEHLFDLDKEEIKITDYQTLPIGILPNFCKNSRFILEENVSGFTELHIHQTEKNIILDFFNGYKKQRITAGLGAWAESTFTALGRTPKLLTVMNPYKSERIHIAACAGGDADTLKIIFRHLSDPQTEFITICVQNCMIQINFECIQDMLPPDCSILRGHTI